MSTPIDPSTLPKFTGKLTAEHLAYVEQIQQEWMTAGLSTERCDRALCEQALHDVYETAGLTQPKLVLWMDSPLGGLFAYGATEMLLKSLPEGDQLRGQLGGQLRGQLGDQLRGQLGDQLGGQLRGQLRDQLRGQLRDQLRDQLRGQLRDQLRGQLRGQLGDQLRDQLRGQLRDQLGGQLRDQLRDQLRGQLGDQLRGQLGDQLRDQLRGQLRDQLGGQLRGQLRDQLRGQLRGQLRDQLDRNISNWWDGYWLGLYGAALPMADIPMDAKLEAVSRLSKNCGWWWPYEGVAILTDRPTVLTRDDQFLLHGETGPALLYADGYSMHAWHGTRVPGWVVESPTAEKIQSEENTEIRRCAIESFGWDNYLDTLGVEPVCVEDDPGNPGHTLALYDLPSHAQMYGEPVRLVVMTNASADRGSRIRRRYAETVPMSCRTAVAAQAWAFDVSEDVYRQLARAT